MKRRTQNGFNDNPNRFRVVRANKYINVKPYTIAYFCDFHWALSFARYQAWNGHNIKDDHFSIYEGRVHLYTYYLKDGRKAGIDNYGESYYD
jgi:hypothetical protein